eukprot:scpid44399/ scgid7647/ 
MHLQQAVPLHRCQGTQEKHCSPYYCYKFRFQFVRDHGLYFTPVLELCGIALYCTVLQSTRCEASTSFLNPGLLCYCSQSDSWDLLPRHSYGLFFISMEKSVESA